MEKANNCQRVVATKYMCGGMTTCIYYEPEKGRKHRFMHGPHCEHRCYNTEECLCRAAKAAADVAGMASTSEKGGSPCR